MQDEQTFNEQAQADRSENVEKIVDETPKIDWMLQSFVLLANHGYTGFGVTLNVKGNLISGTFISNKRYFEKLSKLVEQAIESMRINSDSLTNEQIENLKDNFRKQFNYLNDLANENEDENKTNISNVIYIHLDNARMFNGSVATPDEKFDGVLWRGRLSCIDGFMLGTIGTGQKTSYEQKLS